MKKVHILSACFFCLILLILFGLPSCEISEKVFIEPVPVALDATDVTAKAFRANWTAVLGASGYEIQVALDASFSEIIANEFSDSLFIEINELEVDQQYFYRVSARRGDNLSDFSNIIQVSTTTIGAPSIFTLADTSAVSFQVCWEQVDGAAGYQIEVSLSNTFNELISLGRITNPEDTCFTVTSLAPNQAYFVRLFTITNTNTNALSTPSSPIEFKTLNLSAPTALTAKEVSPVFFKSNWESVEGAENYLVQVSSALNFSDTLYSGTVQNPDTIFDINLFSVRIGQTYHYRVRAESANSISDFSNTITVDANTLGDTRLLEIRNDLISSNRQFGLVKFSYDNNCRLSQIDWEDPRSVVPLRRVINYNSEGMVSQVLEQTSNGASFNLARTSTYFYNDGDELVDSISIVPVSGSERIWVLEYDDLLRVSSWTEFVSLAPLPSFSQEFTVIFNYSTAQEANPSSANIDINSGGTESWQWVYGDSLNPMVMINPNLSLMLPTLPFSSPAEDTGVSLTRNQLPFVSTRVQDEVILPNDDLVFLRYGAFGANILPGNRSSGSEIDLFETYTYGLCR